jgi:hypothetical protein
LDVRSLDDAISVTGSAKQAVSADNSRWAGSFFSYLQRGYLKEGYSQMKKDERSGLLLF